MCKLYRHPIEVQTNRDNMPIAFRWRRRWYKVTSCTIKEDKPSWPEWYREPEPPRYRCETRQGMVCDLFQDESGWVLERVWD